MLEEGIAAVSWDFSATGDRPMVRSCRRAVLYAVDALPFSECVIPEGCEGLFFAILAVAGTAAILAVRWRSRARALSRKLQEAEASVRYLNDKLLHNPPSNYPKKKEIRIFMVRRNFADLPSYLLRRSPVAFDRSTRSRDRYRRDRTARSTCSTTGT
jgi:hypothetical protein